MAQGTETEEPSVVEIRLLDGEKLEAHVKGRADIGAIRRTLDDSEFVQIGDDTIVRSSEVRLIQVRQERSGGMLDSLMSRVGGGGGGHEDDSDDRDVERRSPMWRPRVERLIETKPFFLTSEFLLAFATWIGLAIATAASDQLEASDFWLLTIVIAAFYGISRGFAKAHSPSESWDPREDLFQNQRGGVNVNARQ